MATTKVLPKITRLPTISKKLLFTSRRILRIGETHAKCLEIGYKMLLRAMEMALDKDAPRRSQWHAAPVPRDVLFWLEIDDVIKESHLKAMNIIIYHQCSSSISEFKLRVDR